MKENYEDYESEYSRQMIGKYGDKLFEILHALENQEYDDAKAICNSIGLRKNKEMQNDFKIFFKYYSNNSQELIYALENFIDYGSFEEYFEKEPEGQDEFWNRCMDDEY